MTDPKVAVARAALESPVTVEVAAIGDTTIKQGTPNQGFGGDLVVRLQASGRNRGILLFDTPAIAQAVGTGTLVSAQLVLDVDSTGNNWGEGAPIGAHRLTSATAEYGGTWNCSVDANIYNGAADCSGATSWTMWSSSNPSLHPWIEPATGLATITSNQTGSVSLDVTSDVAGYLAGTLVNDGWLLKKQDEGSSGQIDFKSKERGASVGPRLVLTVQPSEPPTAGAGGSAGSGGAGTGDSSTTTVLTAAIDSHIRQGSPNQNYGTSTVMQIKASGRNRALVAFDGAAIQAALNGRALTGAALELTIAETHANWGPDRALGAHSLKQAWNELGVTWNCSWDQDPSNSEPDCPDPENIWTMWGASASGAPWFDPPKATAVISSGQVGNVTFDVTRDLACYIAGYHSVVGSWLIKKELESEAGWIDFASRETGTPPRLLITTSLEGGVQVTAQDCNPPTGTGACTPINAVDTTCDGVDDDCDGQADDEFSVYDTSCGFGPCASTGAASCLQGVLVDTCEPGVPPGQNDQTCNSIDDDCSGQTDEDFPSQVTTCGTGHCAATGTITCVGGNVIDTCALPCEAVCIDRVDDDGDLSIDCEDSDCVGRPECVVGGACTTNEDCAVLAPAPHLFAGCEVGFPGGYCLGQCDFDNPDGPCPPGAACWDGQVCVLPCLDGDQCARPDHHCQDLAAFGAAGDRVCLPNCSAGSCPEGSHCGAGTQLCITCEEGEGGDTSCDGDDNDCDGMIDEGFVPGTRSCGRGACVVSVPTTCVAGAEQANCEPLPGCEEFCADGQDDDLDGDRDCDDSDCAGTPECLVGAPCDNYVDCLGLITVDTIDASCNETFPGGYCTRACGTRDPFHACPEGSFCFEDAYCVRECDVLGGCSSAEQQCQTLPGSDSPEPFCRATCGNATCPEATRCDVASSTCIPCTASDTSCDGIDNDCDSVADDDYPVASTSCGVGACARTGEHVCLGGLEVDTCAPGTAAANDASCDASDDDCDGATDEDATPVATTCGVGACAAQGTISCVDGQTVVDCVPATGAPDDVTCDGVDDDCDGVTDEDFTPVTAACGTGGCRVTTTTSCVDGVLLGQCVPPTDCESWLQERHRR